jgi:4'-phosphopantetheinyl transferase
VAAPGLSGAVLWLHRIAPLAAEAERGLLDSLSPTERGRLERIGSARRRAEFLAGRLLLRRLLAATRGGALVDWVLAAPEDGPPLAPADAGVHLALSHSGGWVAGAVSAQPAGLDIEAPGRTRDVLALADAVCSTAERARLRALDGPARDAAFREVWTLKEAWLKRRGEGVAPQRLAAIDTWAGGTDAWTWVSADLTLAWTCATGTPRWLHGQDTFGACSAAAWGIDDPRTGPQAVSVRPSHLEGLSSS